MSQPFPAVVIGGPPHSGKSVLVYSLTRALRTAHIAHYVLRACPDGEGDWANEADQQLVKMVRDKGDFTTEFVETVVRDLRQRHLPLLVDVGGRPKAWQEAIFSQCTHAILLAPEGDQYLPAMDTWQQMMTRHSVSILAQIQSNLRGNNQLLADMPLVMGAISHLERGTVASGPTVTALVNRLQTLLGYSEEALAAIHLAQAPVEISLHLPDLAHTLGATDRTWRPEHLPLLADYLPTQVPLAAYGRAPVWVYAFLAAQVGPAPIWLFDARLGWVQPPTLPWVSNAANWQTLDKQTGWQVALLAQPDHTVLMLATDSQYLDIEAAQALPLIYPPQEQGVIVNGRLPNWLVMAIVRELGPRLPWLAVYQPSLAGAVVVASNQAAEYPPGQYIPLA